MPRFRRSGRQRGQTLALAATAAGLAALIPTHTRGQEPGGRATPTEEVADLLQPYMGRWTAERREDSDGRGYRFTYRLEWFDSDRTIAELEVGQRFEDGELRRLWKGFKGRDAAPGEVYYHGFSPSGRWARGSVFRRDSTLVTEYEGHAPPGDPVRIRDVFYPVADDGRFLGITYMRREGEWREINRDHWERDAAKSSDTTGGASRGEPTVAAPRRDVPEPLRRLSYLLGEWRADPVEFLAPDGTVVRHGVASGENRAVLDGLAIRSVGRLEEPAVEVHGWYTVDPDGRIRWSTVTSDGRYLEYSGDFEGADLVLTSEPRPGPDGKTIVTRRVDSNIGPEGHRYALFLSSDGGDTWRLLNRQVNRKL